MKKTGNNILIALIPLFTVSFVSHIAPYIYIPSLPDIADDLRLDEAQAGSMKSAYYLALSLTLLLVGIVGDRWNKRRMLAGASAVIFIGAMLGSLPSQFGWVLCGWALQGVGAATITIVGQTWLGQSSDKSNVTSLFSYMSILLSFAPLVARGIGGMVTDGLSWKYNFFGVGLLSVFSVLFIYKTTPPPPVQNNPVSVRQVFSDYRHILFRSGFVPLIATSLACFFFQGTLMAYSSFLFIDRLGLTPAAYGLISVPVVVGSIIGQFPVLYLEKKCGITAAFLFNSMVAVTALLSSLAFYMLTGTHTVVELALVILVFSIGFGGHTLLAIRNVMTAFPSKRSHSSALLNFLNQFTGYIAAIAVQLLFACIGSVLSVHNMACGAASVFILFTSFIYLKHVKTNEISL